MIKNFRRDMYRKSARAQCGCIKEFRGYSENAELFNELYN